MNEVYFPSKHIEVKKILSFLGSVGFYQNILNVNYYLLEIGTRKKWNSWSNNTVVDILFSERRKLKRRKCTDVDSTWQRCNTPYKYTPLSHPTPRSKLILTNSSQNHIKDLFIKLHSVILFQF